MNALGKLLVRLGAENPAQHDADDYWYRPAPGVPASRLISPSAALRLGTVWACVCVISETIGSLPFNVYRRLEGSAKELARTHSLFYLLHDSPNPAMTAQEFWKLAGMRICTHGNFYAKIVTNARDEVVELRPMNPARMTVTRDLETGLIVYRYITRQGQLEISLADEVFHIPGLGYDAEDNLTGYSPCDMHRQALGLSLDAETYGARFFANNANSGWWLQSSQALGVEKKKEILTWLLENFGGVKNAGKPAILDAGTEIKSIPVNHRDMQFIELRKYQTEEICRIFRVPPHLVQDLSRSTNNNIEHQAIDFVTHTIRPWAEMIEQRVNLQLLGPREASRYFCEFNLDAILRGDAASRAAYYSKLFNIAGITPNEIRVRENLNPKEGGDELYVQGAIVPLPMAGQKQTQRQQAKEKKAA